MQSFTTGQLQDHLDSASSGDDHFASENTLSNGHGLFDAKDDEFASENILLKGHAPSDALALDLEAPNASPDSPFSPHEEIASNRNELSLTPTSPWQKAVVWLNTLSEFCNTGIVFDIAGPWIGLPMEDPRVKTTIWLLEAAIYLFKVFMRLTYLIGETFFNVTFDDRRNGRHPHQSKADITCAIFFALTIPLLLGVEVLPPYEELIAWVLGLSGLSVSAYFDYHYQAELADKKYNLLGYSSTDTEEYIKHCTNDHKTKKAAAQGYYALIASLTVLLISHSTADLVPNNEAQYLDMISTLTGAFLGGVAVFRFANWVPTTEPWKYSAAKIKAAYNYIKSSSCCHQTDPAASIHPDSLSPTVKLELSFKPQKFSKLSPVPTHYLMEEKRIVDVTDEQEALVPSGTTNSNINSINKIPTKYIIGKQATTVVRKDSALNRFGVFDSSSDNFQIVSAAGTNSELPNSHNHGHTFPSS